MSMTAVMVAGEDGSPDPPSTGEPLFLGSLVERLHADFGVDASLVRHLATEVLATFATARIQAFVPILVEKNLRATLRGQRGTPSPHMPGGSPDRWSAAGRRPG